MTKAIFCAAIIAMAGSFAVKAIAADTNSQAVFVESIKADYAAQSPNNIFYYTFTPSSGLPGGCGKMDDKYAKSGDSNINRILQMAYALDAKVKVGLDDYNSCVITTAIVSDSY